MHRWIVFIDGVVVGAVLGRDLSWLGPAFDVAAAAFGPSAVAFYVEPDRVHLPNGGW